MDAVARLQRDHDTFRAKLNALEGMLAVGPETWFELREVCHTLARQLTDHIKREEELVAAGHEVLVKEGLLRMGEEHHEEAQYLKTLNWLFVQDRRYTLEQVRSVLSEFIVVLRQRMAEQEATLFPKLERM